MRAGHKSALQKSQWTQIIRCPVKLDFLPSKHLWFNNSTSRVKFVLSTLHTLTREMCNLHHFVCVCVCARTLGVWKNTDKSGKRKIWTIRLPRTIWESHNWGEKNACDDALLITAEWYVYTNVSVELMVQWLRSLTAASRGREARRGAAQTWSRLIPRKPNSD